MRILFRTSLIVAMMVLMGQTAAPREVSTPSQAGTLSVMPQRLAKGEAAAVAKEIDEQFLKYNATDMPKACYLRGKARMAVAAGLKGDEKKAMLLSAGLDFMRLLTYYPYADDCDDALKSAQKALADAGDAEGAKAVTGLIAKRAATPSDE